MSIVIKIGPKDDIGQRAHRAIWEASRDGQKPVRWIFGRETWDRLRRNCAEWMEIRTFYGLPFVVQTTAPHDLLELDVF